MQTDRRKRIKSIDMLRGLVMIIMALDHVRDYFHYDAFFFDPTDLTKTNVALFWTRFVTHFCAPVFVFLAGTSAFFVGQRRDKKSLSIWLLKRGLWLLIAELTIIKLAWMFQLDYTTTLLQVIWVLGMSMIFLAGFIHFPKKLMIALAIVVVCGHNLLDSIAPSTPLSSGIWTFLHVFNIVEIGGFQIFVGYPLIPWIFVMPLGYYFGELYTPSVDSKFRTKRLFQLGIGLTLLFFVLRTINVYGDPFTWSQQESLGLTIASFFNVTKYPPSLFYLLITLGPSIIFLALAEHWQGKLTDKLVVIGRVPMFFYILHIYVIHFFGVIAALATGFSFSDMVIDLWVTLQPDLQGYGFDLWVVYLIWVLLTIALYPFCSWYNDYKTAHREKWWLSYL
ncbi:MAG: heparan-alpha-glucosaminide N-acetyltransferase domain-containing protein [Flavobacteriaceae bacterium]